MNTIKINKLQLKKAIALANAIGRYDELERNASFISATKLEARRSILRRQIQELLDSPKEESQVVQIQISLTPEELEKKSSFTLKDLLSSRPSRRKEFVLEDEEENILGLLESQYPQIYQFMVKK